MTPTSSQGRGGSSSRARVEAPDPEKKSKSNVEEQLSKCKYKRMISRYFLCLTEMRLRFAKLYSYVPLRGSNKYKKKDKRGCTHSRQRESAQSKVGPIHCLQASLRKKTLAKQARTCYVKPHRIFLLCFLVFVMEQALEKKTKDNIRESSQECTCQKNKRGKL